MKTFPIIKTTIFTLIFCVTTTSANDQKNTQFTAQKAPGQSLVTSDETERQRVEFVWPTVMSDAQLMSRDLQSQSNEYWQKITGKELNRGLVVYAYDNALIRIAPLATYRSGARQVSPGINLNQLNLTHNTGAPAQFELLAEQAQMQSAGFNDGSVALKVNDKSRNPLKLQSQARLNDADEYLLHVKEKQSPHKLDFSLPSHINGGNALDYSAALSGQELVPMLTEAKVLAPSGEQLDAKLRNKQIILDSPLEQAGAIDGLYQVELHTLGNINGKLIKRSIKLPFVNVLKTAAIEDVQIKDRIYVALEVIEPGRYNLTATLQAKDQNGVLHKLQTADVAEFLSQSGEIALPFELADFDGFSDFNIVDVKLTDQSRLMPLAVYSSL